MTEPSWAAGTRLRLARQARGLSQQQLAGMAAVTRQAVSAVESGHSDPSLRVALALARALGVTIEELFGPGDPGDPVLAQPVAPVGGEGARVTLATVGDTFVALPMNADTLARAGFRRETDKTWRDYVNTWIDFNKGLGFIRNAIITNMELVGVTEADIPPGVSL